MITDSETKTWAFRLTKGLSQAKLLALAICCLMQLQPPLPFPDDAP